MARAWPCQRPAAHRPFGRARLLPAALGSASGQPALLGSYSGLLGSIRLFAAPLGCLGDPRPGASPEGCAPPLLRAKANGLSLLAGPLEKTVLFGP